MSANRATITLTAEVANARTAHIALEHADTDAGKLHPETSRQVVDLYLSSDAAGDTPVNPVSGDVVPTAGTNGSMIDKPITGTKASWKMIAEAAGMIDVVLTNATDLATTVYLHVILASGKVLTSAAITFLDD